MSKRKEFKAEEDSCTLKRTRINQESHSEDVPQNGFSKLKDGNNSVRVRGQPPAWAENRYSLGDALSWFRSVQGGIYQSNKVCLGLLLDQDSGSRTYIDDEIVITRVGGGCTVNKEGKLIQEQDQTQSTRPVDSLLASKRAGVAVGLIIGNRNKDIKRELPHRFNVMAWFRVVDVWFEKFNGKTGAQVRFQKLNLENPSWWAVEGSSDPPPLCDREFTLPQSNVCSTCFKSSNRVYEQGWMCLNHECTDFWHLETGTAPPEKLRYHADFLRSREPVDSQVQPEVNLVPDVPTSLLQYPDASTQRIAWRGVVCPECRKCVSRRYWKGWVCSDPSDVKTACATRCQWKLFVDMPLISLRSVVSDPELGVIKRAVRLEEEDGSYLYIQPRVLWTREYQKFTYVIEGAGTVVHYSANRTVLGQPNGPNELFEKLQKIDLGLRRYPLKQAVVEGTLTAHFAVNFGMPYKYVVAVDSKSFSQAPDEVMCALGRLTWATQNAVGPEAHAPNELLLIGYFEKMAMGYHDDGESMLGPTIATLSLGANATMRIRLKDKYFRGCRRQAKEPLEDDTVLPGCFEFRERRNLKEKYQRGEIKTDEYKKSRMELANKVKRREGENIINLSLHHGDMVVMHGTLLQKCYEHSVTAEDKLRFALTSRFVRPDMVNESEHHKGQFELRPDQKYHGQ